MAMSSMIKVFSYSISHCAFKKKWACVTSCSELGHLLSGHPALDALYHTLNTDLRNFLRHLPPTIFLLVLLGTSVLLVDMMMLTSHCKAGCKVNAYRVRAM